MSECRPYTPEDLIAVVQALPALWDKGHPDHSCAHLCQKYWFHIAKIYEEGFDELSRTEQSTLVKKYKTKWRSIQDAYVKELNQIQKEQRSGSGSSRRTVYCFSQQLSFLRTSVEPRDTEDNFAEETVQRCAEAEDTSEEDMDDEVTDRTFAPPTRGNSSESRRSSDDICPPGLLELSQPAAGPQEVGDTQSPTLAETETGGEPPEDIAVQHTRRTTPSQRRGRSENTTPTSRRRPGPVPTRRQTKAEMSGAVSGLLGILRSHESTVTKHLQDGDRGHLMVQYRAHIESLQAELETVHRHNQDELKLMHEQYRAQFKQLRLEHQQSVSQMQQQMQQMHQQQMELMGQQAHPSFHMLMSLIPFLEKVPSMNMYACHSSLLEAVKPHME